MSTSYISNGEAEFSLENPNESALIRAAEISVYITSTTIGPNSSFNPIIEQAKENGIGKGHNQSPSQKSTTPNQHKIKTPSKRSSLDINDLKSYRQRMIVQQKEKQIDKEVRKQLEKKRNEEVEKYRIIQERIDEMKLEAERIHRSKMEELERKIKYELDLEQQKEQVYQEQKKELAANTRKIQEEKDKIQREQLKKVEKAFAMEESHFIKLFHSCNPEMASAVTFWKQFGDIKNFRDSHKNSYDANRLALSKMSALTKNIQKVIGEYETALNARRAQQEAEAIQLRAQAQAAAQAQAEAEAAAALAEKSEVIVPKQIALVQPQPNQDELDQAPHDQTSPLIMESFRVYNECKQLLITKRNQTRTLDEAPELQQLRFMFKLAINNTINVLNEKIRSTLLDGYQNLFNLLDGQRVSTTKGDVAITIHNEASDWCKLRIAEKLIDRCDKEPTLSFYAAAIAIALWQKFPDFGEIFKALLYKECPFLMPFKPPKLNNQSNEEFLSSWGFRLTNGVCEGHVHYEGRTTKFATLMGALWVSYPRRGESENPFGIRFGWKYFAAVLNNPPDSNYLHIIGKLLEISGFMMHKVYGKQFVKLMAILRDRYMPVVHSAVDEETSASFNRLRDIIIKFFAENKFVEPAGRLMPGYW